MNWKLFISIGILLFCKPAVGQVMFQKTYGGFDSEFGNHVEQTGDGGYIIAGITNSFDAGQGDVYLIKTNINGDVLWTRSYGETDSDYGFSVHPCLDNGYIIAGMTRSFGAGGSDVYLIKTDDIGDTVWTRTFGGPNDEYGWDVEVCLDSGFIITGYTSSYGAGAADVYLVKTDRNGNAIWSRTFGGTNNELGQSVSQTNDGGYIVGGMSFSYGAGSWDNYLIKTNSTGSIMWSKVYGGAESEEVHSVMQCTDGGYILAGETQSFGAGNRDGYLIKTNSFGVMQWAKTYGGPSLEDFRSVQQTNDGGYIVTGISSTLNPNDVYLLKTDSNGDTLWVKTYGGMYGHEGSSVRQCADGGYVICGRRSPIGPGGTDVYLIKTDAWGNSGGCIEYNSNTTVGNPAFATTTGGVAGSGIIANSTSTLFSNTPTIDSTLCFAVEVPSPVTNNQSPITIYPNPFTTSTTLQVEGLTVTANLQLYDQLGRQVRSQAITQPETTIHRQRLPAGIYFYNLQSEHGLRGSGKLVVVD